MEKKLVSVRKNIEDGLKGLAQSVGMRLKKIVDPTEPSGDNKFLFAPGHIEKLVREERTPFFTGISSGSEESSLYYQVLPPNFNHKKIRQVGMVMDVLELRFEDGTKVLASTYYLTKEQAATLNERVEAEKRRLT